MPLGPQFRDTYWHDAAGNAQMSEDTGAVKPEIGDMRPTDRTEHPLQGMLFDPYTGTGLRQDPMVSPEKRQQVIKDSLGLNDVERYRRRLGTMVRSQQVKVRRRDENGQPLQTERRSDEYTITSKRGPRAAKEDMDLIAKALDETDMPTHVIGRTAANAVLDPNSGRAYAEDHSGNIRLTTSRDTKVTRIPEQTVTRPSVTRGEPIRNTNFHSQVQKIDWGSEEGAHADLVEGGDTGYGAPSKERADVRFWHAQTGEEVHPDSNSHSEGGHIVEADVHSNIWPGSGKTTDKVIATPFRVYNGIDYNGHERWRTFHTRHAAVQGPEETVTIPERIERTVERGTSSRTIVHELGHVRDTATTDPFSHRRALSHTADPLEEGLADGHADRFSRYAGKFEETLHPDYPQRSNDIANGPGYGIDYHHWKNDRIGKALYVAARSHAAMSDDAVTSVPSRKSLAEKVGISTPSEARAPEGRVVLGGYTGPRKSTDKGADVVHDADRMVLGHLYGEHEHVRAALHNLGMGKVGQEAHEAYQSRLEAAQPKKSQQFEQLTFPGV